MSLVTTELEHFIERLFEQSVVLLYLGDAPWATGFFVSDDGLICCCHHGFDPLFGARVSMLYEGARYDVEYLAEQSAIGDDLSYFQADLTRMGVDRTRPVPVYAGGIAGDDPGGPAITLGFAGITDSAAPIRLRAFTGSFTGVALYDRSSPGGAVPRIETRDVTVGKGNSGGPLLDVRRFRVIGYVQGALKGVFERMGRASTLSAVVDAHPHLERVWREAGAEFDAAKRRYFDESRQPIPSELATPGDLRARIGEHNQRVVETLRKYGIYNPDLFVSRAVSARVEGFIESGDARIALVTGESGTGKTNLLTDLCHRLAGAGSVTIPILVTCGSLEAATPLDAILADLGIRGDLRDILRRASSRDEDRVLLILDGYNEWPRADGDHFQRLIARLAHILQELSRVRVIIGAKTEFLREHANELFVSSETDRPTIGLYREILHHEEGAKKGAKKGSPRPFIEVPTLDDAETPGQQSEQEVMYERYRSHRTMKDAAGQEVGIRPRTPYQDVPDTIRKLLDRPLLLRQFMIRYDNELVPARGFLRSSLYREVVTPDIKRFAPSWLTREAVEVLLGNLARHLSARGIGSAPLRHLVKEPWFDRGIIELLVSHTFILLRSRSAGSMIDATTIGFTSEWLLEYYLALDIWEEVVLEETDRVAYLQAAAADLSQARLHELAGALTFVGEWALTKNHSVLVNLLKAASSEAWDPQWSAFVSVFFEFVRTHYTFAAPVPSDVPGASPTFGEILVDNRRELDAPLMRRVLAYAERTGDRAIRDVIGLLSLDESLWQVLGPAWRTEVFALRALKRFRLETGEDIEAALQECSRLDASSAPGKTRSLIAFVTGRCHQYFQRYDAAMQSYMLGKDGDDEYGDWCRHQIAFVRFLRESDYAGAAALLDQNARRLGTKSFGDGQSALLYAHCLIELGRFADAYELVDGMSRRRTRGMGRARALRALANLHFRTFETDLAIGAAERAAAQSRERENVMPHAEANEILATVLACHVGEIPRALALIRASRATAAERSHKPSISWFAQTEALIHALTGDRDAVEAALRVATDAGLNPNQERRSSLIRILVGHCGGRSQGANGSPLFEEMTDLRTQYAAAGQSWYAAILDLLMAVRSGQDTSASEAARAWFPKGISESGLEESHLFQVIRGAR